MKWKLTPNGILSVKKSLMNNILNQKMGGSSYSEVKRDRLCPSDLLKPETAVLPRKEGLAGEVDDKNASGSINDNMSFEEQEGQNQKQDGRKKIRQGDSDKATGSQAVDSDMIRRVERQLENAVAKAKKRSAEKRSHLPNSPRQEDAGNKKEISPAIQGTNETIPPKIVLLLAPDSIEAECFRLLRSLLFFSSPDNKPRSILFTNASPGEILMVDCDLRNPKLHELLGIGRIPGLSDYFFQDVLDQEKFCRINDEQFYIVPGGRVSQHPTGTMNPFELHELFGEIVFSCENRTVIFDSKPHAYEAGASDKNGYIDGTLMVVDYGVIPHENIKGILSLIGRDKILGCVTGKTVLSFI